MKDKFPYKIVQEGTLIGEVKNLANVTSLPMYDYWKKTKIYKNGKLLKKVM